MLYFVCATWEELLHSFLWLLHVPFAAEFFCLWSGGQIDETLPFWPGVLWGAGAWRKDKFTSMPEAQVSSLPWATLPALLRGWCVLPVPGHADWALAFLGSWCRDGAEPGLDSWQEPVPVRWGSSWELWVIPLAATPCSQLGTACPALAVQLLGSQLPHLLLPTLLVAVSAALVTQQPSGVAAVPVPAPSLSLPEVLHWSSLCCTSGPLQVTDVALWHC